MNIMWAIENAKYEIANDEKKCIDIVEKLRNAMNNPTIRDNNMDLSMELWEICDRKMHEFGLELCIECGKLMDEKLICPDGVCLNCDGDPICDYL